jgi:hypothetical protein
LTLVCIETNLDAVNVYMPIHIQHFQWLIYYHGNLYVSYIIYCFLIYLSVLIIISSYSRMLVYEYVNNGNLEQWLHGAMRQHGVLTWEARMKIILGIAKA